MKTKHLILIIVFLFSIWEGCGGVFAQFSPEEQHQIDSLNAIINNPQSHDTSLAISYVVMGELLYNLDIDTLFYFANKAALLCEQNFFNKELLTIEKNIFSKISGNAYNDIAYYYDVTGQIDVALKYYYKSLNIREELKDLIGLATTSSNIAMIYESQGEQHQAIELLLKSVEFQKQANDNSELGYTFMNLGSIYFGIGESEKSIYYYSESIALHKLNDDNRALLVAQHGLAKVYFKQNKIEKTDSILSICIENIGNIGSPSHEAIIYELLTEVSLNKNELENALKYGQIALQKAEESFDVFLTMTEASLLSKVYKKANNFKKALEMYELHIQMRDSINNEETQKASIRQQTKYEFEKEQLVAEQQLSEELRVKDEKLKRRNNLQYSIILVGILVVFGLVLSLGFVSISPKFAEGLIFFAFLILFEFLLVLSDPYVDGITNGEPMYKLLLNAVLAGAIFPLHSFFERYLKGRLVKNKE